MARRRGHRQTAATRAKISAALKGRKRAHSTFRTAAQAHAAGVGGKRSWRRVNAETLKQGDKVAMRFTNNMRLKTPHSQLKRKRRTVTVVTKPKKIGGGAPPTSKTYAGVNTFNPRTGKVGWRTPRVTEWSGRVGRSPFSTAFASTRPVRKITRK